MHLTDAYCLTQPSSYISALLLALRTMLQMDLPHVNVLAKIDRLADYAPLPFNLAFYTEVQDLSYLLPHLAAERPQRRWPGDGGSSSSSSGNNAPDPQATPPTEEKFAGLNRAVISLVEDFGLVGFETLAVEDRRSMMGLLRAVDRAGGYAFGAAEGANDSVWQVVMREGFQGMSVDDVQERWIDRREEFDEKERREQEERTRREAERAREAEESEGNDDLGNLELPTKDSGVKVVRKGT